MLKQTAPKSPNDLHVVPPTRILPRQLHRYTRSVFVLKDMGCGPCVYGGDHGRGAKRLKVLVLELWKRPEEGWKARGCPFTTEVRHWEYPAKPEASSRCNDNIEVIMT